jgi:phage terminase large subunit-like protein
MVRLACRRHLEDLRTGGKRGLWFDEEAANRVLQFFGFLKQSKGRWAQQPIDLQPSQVFRIGSVFGWKRADGSRRFRVAYNEVPRKYGKTTEAAGIGNYLAFFEGEPGAEVYATATKRDQAKICWNEAKWQMSNAPAKLKARLDIRVANMNRPDNASKFEALGADKDGTDGLNPHGIVLDEIHAWKSEEFLGKLETASGARSQPLRWVITTAGTQTSTIYLSEHGYAEQVLRGNYEDDSWFVFISCADDPEKWGDEEQWQLANPHIGVTVSLDVIRDEFRRAKVSPAKQSMFKRMYLGIITSSAEAWLNSETWDAQQESIGVEDGASCSVGGDLSSIRDLTAMTYWFPDDDGDGGELIAKLYMPEEGITKRVSEDGVPYDAWAAAGHITLTPGASVDYDFIIEDFRAMAEQYTVRSLGMDPWNGIQVRTALERDGFTVVKVPQSHVRLNACVDEAERLFGIGRVRCANPVMRWMAMNAVVSTDAHKNRKLDKVRSPEKIDGIVAWLNALSEAMATADEPPSVYEERGILDY